MVCHGRLREVWNVGKGGGISEFLGGSRARGKL